MRRAGLLALSIGALYAAPARADDAPALPAPRLVPELSLSKDKAPESVAQDSWSTRKKQVSLMGGSPGSPAGIVGFTFEYSPIKYVVLGAGGGYSPEGGIRGTFMPRLRLPLTRWFAVGMGVPLTLGQYEYSEKTQDHCSYSGCEGASRTTRSWSFAAWGQLEPNVELRVGGGLALRVFAGYARVLNDDDDRCTSSLLHGCPSTIGNQKIYGGLTVGYAW